MRYAFTRPATMVLFMIAAVALAEAAEDSRPFLEHLITHHQGWGELGIDTCAHAPGVEALPLRIGDRSYERGVGTHAPGELVFMLDGQFKTFTAEVGVQPQSNGAGSVFFTILVDGEERFASGVLRENDAPVSVSIDLTGADELRIVVGDTGDGITCDVANIGNPELVRDTDAAEDTIRRLEISSFGEYKTWPPDVSEGTSGKRTEPFPPDDVYLGTPVKWDSDTMLPVPVDDDDVGCIGIEWAERRLVRDAALVFNATRHIPALKNVTLQTWDGESPWQGRWVDVDAAPVRAGDSDQTRSGPRLLVRLPFPKETARRGTEKIRWLIRDCPRDLRIRALPVTTFSRLREDGVKLRMILEHPDGTDAASADSRDEWQRFRVYNGFVVMDRTGADAMRAGAWQDLGVVCADAKLWKADRAVLQFYELPTPVAVAVDDVVEHGSVYVPSAGLIVTRADVETSFDAERQKVASMPSLLERVRAMPDQTLEQAMEHVHNPIQDLGPTMLSLAADNRKFVAHRNGAVTFDAYSAPDDEVPLPDQYRFRLEVRRDGATAEPESRRMLDGWLPAPVSTWRSGNVEYTQTVYVAPGGPTVDSQHWLHSRAICVIDVEAQLVGDQPGSVHMDVRLLDGVGDTTPVAFADVGEGVFAATVDGVVRAWVVPRRGSELTATVSGGVVSVRGELGRYGSAGMRVLLPAWPTQDAPPANDHARDDFREYWHRVMKPATQITLPDAFLADLIRASQVHILLAARNEEHGERIAAWISADRYGPFESEAHAVIRGMDLMGQEEYTRRSLDYFIHRYAPEGYLTTGYTIVGTGWHLWTLADYFARSNNRYWLNEVAPEVARACQWIVDERAKTMQHPGYRGGDTAKHPSPYCPAECGLMPPTVAADWNRYAYRFFQEGHYYAGLKKAAEALQTIGYDGADGFSAEADALREATLRAYRHTQGRAPAQALETGAWIPAYPGMLYSYGRIEDIIPGEDWNRSWCYDVELGAHHLAALGVLDPGSGEVGDMLEHMEEFWFLHQGMGDYPEEMNHEDWYNLGGFAKVQPYYARNAELYAMRDDVKPFVRSYFNTIPTLVSRENMSFWEHFHNMGGWNKTHETGYFLAQTREMLIQERGNELWIAPLVPEHWLHDGGLIWVRKAPCRFGWVDYRIGSGVAKGEIDVLIEGTIRNVPDAIVVRLRHPEGSVIRAIAASGCDAAVAIEDGRSVRMTPPFAKTIEVKVTY